jgi:transposase InsO family protein
VTHVQQTLRVSQRRACRALGQPRSTQRYQARRPERDRALATRIQELARQHPSYGYRMVAALLRREGWAVNPKRVYRLWRQAGLSHRPKRRKRRRLGTSAGGCVRLRPTAPNHVWSYDFTFDATEDGRRLKWLAVMDEYTRECLALEVGRSLPSGAVTRVMDRLIAERGAPRFVRSDNGPEFVAKAVREHLSARGAETLFIAPGAPWENAYIESFNGTLREDFLGREAFGHMLEAKVLGEAYRQEYNTERPHSAFGYQTPAEYAASQAAGSALTPASD